MARDREANTHQGGKKQSRWITSRRAVLAGGVLGIIPTRRAAAGWGDDSIRTFKGHSRWINSVAIGPDGRTAVSGSADKTVKLWDLNTAAMIRSLTPGDDKVVSSVAMVVGGHAALSASGESIKVWDVASGNAMRTLSTNPRSVDTVAAIGADGRRALSWQAAIGNFAVTIWDVASGSAILTFEPDSYLMSIAVAPDGHIALSANDNKTFTLWDLATGKPTRSISVEKGSYPVAIMPDGRRAVSGSGSSENVLKLWDLSSQNGAPIRTLSGHTKAINAIAVSPDGRTAISARSDGTLRLWDLAAGTTIRAFKGHGGEVNAVAITPDGRAALSGSVDGTLKLWNLS
jgi:WD40 repeat protein